MYARDGLNVGMDPMECTVMKQKIEAKNTAHYKDLVDTFDEFRDHSTKTVVSGLIESYNQQVKKYDQKFKTLTDLRGLIQNVSNLIGEEEKNTLSTTSSSTSTSQSTLTTLSSIS